MPLNQSAINLPGVYVENLGGGSPLLASKPFAVLLVGVSNGKTNYVSREDKVKGSGNTDKLDKDYPVDILWVSNSTGGPDGLYRKNIDYKLTSSGQKNINGYVDWSIAPTIDNPSFTSVDVINGTTTGLAGGTYYYKVHAQRRVTGPTTYNSTEASEAVVAHISSTYGHVKLTWTSIVGAERYQIFRSTQSSTWSSTLIKTVDSGICSLTDTGLTTSAGSPSETNTAYRKPYVGQTYYVSYAYKTFSYLTAKEYTRLSALWEDHGKTSELGRMASLVMGTNGTGQEAPLVIAIGLEENTEAAHIAAMGVAETVQDYPLLVVPKTTQLSTQAKWKAHCLSMNDVLQGKHRILFVGPDFNVTYGNTSTVGTIIYNARSLADRLVVYCAPGFVYGEMIQEDGSYAEVALDGSYLAAAVAGRISALGDAAEPGTYKPIYGISRFALPSEASNWYDPTDKTIKKLLLGSGVTVVEQFLGNFRIMQAVTTAIDTQEKFHLNIVTADLWMNRKIKTTLEESGIIGKKNMETVRQAIKSLVEGVLDGLIAAAQIISYTEVEVKQSPINKDWVLVSFGWKPIYPVNIIYVTYVYDLSV